MKFGRVDHPETIDFTLPPDHPQTAGILAGGLKREPLTVYVGCAKWNRRDLKNFYPRGTGDELSYYATQFNAIELNATFYRIFPESTYDQWYEKTPEGFKFFPKIVNSVSHLRRLNEAVFPILDEYLLFTSKLGKKLGTIFLQMHSNFGPKNWDRVLRFVDCWPRDIRLAIEFRHPDWYADPVVSRELYHLLQENNMANILVDTAGRRDHLHMRLTNDEAFVRYVGANHKSDFARLDDWVFRLKEWHKQGLRKIHFFIHQNQELESPLLTAYFIEKINKELPVQLHIPETLIKAGTTF